MVLTGCHSPEIKFNDIRPTPTATIASNNVIVHLGGDYLNSALWVHPKFRVKDQTVYVFGYHTLKEMSREYVIKLPASANSKTITVVWLNPDGSHITIPITK